MFNAALFLRYWYLWFPAALLAMAAASGFRESMQIHIYELVLRLRLWQFILGCAVFLAVLALIYHWLDRRKTPIAGWPKIVHLGISVAFCVLTFVQIQTMNAKRISNSKSYFGLDHIRQYEELHWLLTATVIAFALSQLLFGVLLVRKLLQC